MWSIEIVCKLLAIDIVIIFTNTLNCHGKKNSLLVDVLNKVNTKRYLSGIGAKNYFEPVLFEKAGVEVIWQDFQHLVYP